MLNRLLAIDILQLSLGLASLVMAFITGLIVHWAWGQRKHEYMLKDQAALIAALFHRILSIERYVGIEPPSKLVDEDEIDLTDLGRATPSQGGGKIAPPPASTSTTDPVRS
jgi:hypothetical protein